MNLDIFPDRNIGPAELKDMHGVSSTTLLVRSIFGPTFQGEQPFSGKAAIFVRLGGCNRGDKGVTCGVACDTDFLISKSVLYDVEYVYEEVKRLAYDEAIKLVVITGGEPLMQSGIILLCQKLIQDDFIVQIESNGDFHLNLPGEVKVVISPKAHGLKNHGPIIESEVKAAYYDKNELFPRMNYRGKIAAFRFVVHADWAHPHFLIPEAIIFYCVKSEVPIYLSPMTIYNTKNVEAADLEKVLSMTNSIGWPSDSIENSILNYEATEKNYNYSVKLALKLRKKGFDVGLSMQTHLWFGVK